MPLKMPGRDYIYSNYDPAYTNTYIVKISNPPAGIAISEDLCYLAKSIAFQGETLNLVRDDFTKEFKLSGDTPYNWVNAVTITWNETSFWEIKQFHDRWMGMFYDKEKDVYLSGNNDRYVTFDIRLYPSWNYDYDNGSNEYVRIQLVNCLPAKTGDVNLGWTPSPSVVNHAINYYPQSIKISYKGESNG